MRFLTAKERTERKEQMQKSSLRVLRSIAVQE
jgi:hypothetical protein